MYMDNMLEEGRGRKRKDKKRTDGTEETHI